MSLGVRGINPIWSEFDLQGKLFDDTFYLFVLENTIPYIPAKIYSDPDFNQEINNPIRFLGNGTLPVDVYYESNKVYRLEFRQGNTQQSPLIYEVNNYDPGSGGSSPIDTVAFASDNQITNPQFALFNLQSPTTISGTNPDPIEIAPGWTLLLSGTGSVTINQISLNNSNINPSNAPYALQLTLNGWTSDSVILRQRFQQNGMLWANKFVSNAITTRIEGSPQSITADLVDSNGSVLGTVLPLTTINEEWNEYTGYSELPTTTNPDSPPSAYIDYFLRLPSNIDIYLTSFQVVVQDTPIRPSFEQDSINRQIDHTYNSAYPIIPVGGFLFFGGFVDPSYYYLCNGSEKSRVRDYLLYRTLTTIENVTLTNGLNTFTVVSNENYHIGMAIEGTGIPASTSISNISGTTITMSANATITGSSSVMFFAWGNGNGSTTFNIPNMAGYIFAGANGTLFSGVNGVGLEGGNATHTLSPAEIPELITPYSYTTTTAGAGFNIGTGTAHITSNAVNAGSPNTPIRLVQPTKLCKIYIRYR